MNPSEHTLSAPSAGDFLQAFADRRQCYAELLELSRRQAGLVQADDYTGLLSVLAGKQRVLSRLEAIGRTSGGLVSTWQRDRYRVPPAVRRSCEAALAESETLLAELLEHERESTTVLARRRDETRRQLQNIASGGQANEAYRDTLAPATSRHLDVDQ